MKGLTIGIISGGNSLLAGLLRKYYFTGNANDTSGNGYNGTVNGATLTTDRKSAANAAYSFNGSAEINIANTGINGLASISASCWIYPTTLGDYDAVYCARGASNNNLDLFVLANGNIRFDVGNGITAIYALTTTAPLSINNWYHVVCTWVSGGYAKIYINGSLVTTSAGTLNGNLAIDDVIRFGYDDYSTNRYFYGKIDDARFYNRVLSSPEITALKNE
jgi:hypothetical protein